MLQVRYEEIARATDSMETRGKFSLEYDIFAGIYKHVCQVESKKGKSKHREECMQESSNAKFQKNTSSVKASLINVHYNTGD